MTPVFSPSTLPGAAEFISGQTLQKPSVAVRPAHRRGRRPQGMSARTRQFLGVRPESCGMDHSFSKRPAGSPNCDVERTDTTFRRHVEPVRLRSEPALSLSKGQAPRSGVETSCFEHGVPCIRGQISPLRPPASGRNDNRAEPITDRHRVPAAPVAWPGRLTLWRPWFTLDAKQRYSGSSLRWMIAGRFCLSPRWLRVERLARVWLHVRNAADALTR